MSSYNAVFLKEFEKNCASHKKNFQLQKQIDKKIKDILKNPNHYKTLRNVLKGKQRAHLGSLVLIFEVNETQKQVKFHSIKHHDKAYK